jgi:hypothetical protein
MQPTCQLLVCWRCVIASKFLKSRIARRLLVLLAVVALPVVYWSFSTSANAEPPKVVIPFGPFPTTVLINPKPVEKLTVEQWRNRYPFRSIRSRLAYETSATKPRTKPNLRPSTIQRLVLDEMMIIGVTDVRQRSLAMLHSAKAEEFVKRPGLGIGRIMIPASPSRLPEPNAPPLQMVTVPPLVPSAGSAETVLLPAGKAQAQVGNQRMPSKYGLVNFHRYGTSRQNFLFPGRFGYVKDLDHVAGFGSHKFLRQPKLSHFDTPRGKTPPEKETWLLSRLELVSLLKHDKPRVYVSDHLPDLEKLDEFKTRPLTEHESRGLAKLYDGEDLMIEARPNLIHMVGSLRASKQCLQCHEVERGTLLGAFTYELQRDPPIVEPIGTRVSIR